MNQLVLSAKFQKDLKKILTKQPGLKLAIRKSSIPACALPTL